MAFDLEYGFIPSPCQCEAGEADWVWHDNDCPLFIDSEEYYRVEEDD